MNFQPCCFSVGRSLTTTTGCGGCVELGVDVVVAQDAVDLGDVERAVLEGDAVGDVEAAGDGVDRVDLAVAVAIDHGVDRALLLGSDEDHAVGARRERARPGTWSVQTSIENPGGSSMVSRSRAGLAGCATAQAAPASSADTNASTALWLGDIRE